jgi:ribosomal protein L7Ae-like RNA K-turn-binding protein
LLGFARRAGDVVMGFDQVTASLRKAQPAFRIEASDGARDGRRKIDALARGVWDGVPVAGCFSGEQIGVALGRDRVIHALVSHGGMANRLAAELRRLSGFRPLVPDSWRSDDG